MKQHKNIGMRIILLVLWMVMITTLWFKVEAYPGESGSTGSTTTGPYGSEIQPEITYPDDPMSGTLGKPSGSSSIHTPDEIVNEGMNFIGSGKEETIKGDNLKNASSTLYNILLSIGIFLAVAIGIYLGIKFMLASAEDKAKVKESLIPYIAGCIIIFGAYIIWRFVILLLQKVELFGG